MSEQKRTTLSLKRKPTPKPTETDKAPEKPAQADKKSKEERPTPA